MNFLLVQNRGRPEVLAEIKSPPVVVKKAPQATSRTSSSCTG
jgi:hypothetical protein